MPLVTMPGVAELARALAWARVLALAELGENEMVVARDGAGEDAAGEDLIEPGGGDFTDCLAFLAEVGLAGGF